MVGAGRVGVGVKLSSLALTSDPPMTVISSSRPRSRTTPSPAFLLVLALSLVLHVALIAYGSYQDAHSTVKYTDVDYNVFSDAARAIVQGDRSPSQGMLGGSWIGRSVPSVSSLYFVSGRQRRDAQRLSGWDGRGGSSAHELAS